MTKREELLDFILSLTPSQADAILKGLQALTASTEAELLPCPPVAS